MNQSSCTGITTDSNDGYFDRYAYQNQTNCPDGSTPVNGWCRTG